MLRKASRRLQKSIPRSESPRSPVKGAAWGWVLGWVAEGAWAWVVEPVDVVVAWVLEAVGDVEPVDAVVDLVLAAGAVSGVEEEGNAALMGCAWQSGE